MAPFAWLAPSLLAIASIGALHSAIRKASTGLDASGAIDSLIAPCSLAAAYAALLSHAVAARRADACTGMPRLSPRELGVLIGVVVVLWLYFVPVHLLLPLSAECTASVHCRRHLRSSQLLPAWPVDLADDQWRSFREGLPTTLALATAHVLFGRLAQAVLAPSARDAAAAAFSVAFVLVVHGGRGLIPLTLAAANYALTGWLVRSSDAGRSRRGESRGAGGSHRGIAAAWAFAIGVLLLKEFARSRLSFALGARALGMRLGWSPRGPAQSWAAVLDGQIVGWWAPANLTVLRMLSYSIDTHRSASTAATSATSATTATTASTITDTASTAFAATTPTATAAEARRGVAVYLAYVFYPPLYLAGPIVSYADFARQWAPAAPPGSSTATSTDASATATRQKPPPSPPPPPPQPRQAPDAPAPLTLGYLLRLLLAWLLLEVGTRSFYGFALGR